MLLALAFPFFVLGMLAILTSGWISTLLWTVFYGLLMWVMGSLLLHTTWHCLTLRPQRAPERIRAQEDYDAISERPYSGHCRPFLATCSADVVSSCRLTASLRGWRWPLASSSACSLDPSFSKRAPHGPASSLSSRLLPLSGWARSS